MTTTKGMPDTVDLEDTLTYVTNAIGRYDKGSLLDDIKLVDTSAGKKYDISSLIVKGKKSDKEISIDFSKLPDKYKKDSFRITYTTKAPEASDKSVDKKTQFIFTI